MDKGDYVSAIERLKSSIDLDGTVFETQYNLAVAYTKAEDYSNAIKTYNDAIIPSINTPVNPINIYTNYSIKDIPISTETIHVNIPEHEDFEIINSFANKMLTEATPIDEEIQNVINDHFLDML